MKWTDTQKKVLTDEGNLLVSASAGSGKTTIMLQKVLELLKKGKDIDKFLIMTFTKASASEMKEKLIKKLYEEIRTTDSLHLKRQLDLLNFSSICTIDSFCFSLYRKYFADIGLEPAFENMDERESKLLFIECTDEILEEYLSKSDDELFYQLLQRYIRNRDVEPLKEAIKQLSVFLDIQTDEEDFINKCYSMLDSDIEKHPAIKLYLEHNIKNLRRFEDEGKDLLQRVINEKLPDKYIDIINNILISIKNISKAKSLESFALAVKKIEFSNMPRCKEDCIYKELADEIKFYNSEVKDYIKKLYEDLEDYYNSGVFLKGSSEDIRKLIELTIRVRNRYQKKKLQKKKFDFADLSKISQKILQVKKLREEVSSEYDYIFVDEYQDTNYIQENIINLICKKDNLFMVGDPKQAIYQFRHAEPKIFIQRYFKYKNAKEGTNEDLNENFRSDKRILDFVNYVFREVMDFEFGGIDYKNNAELSAIEELVFPVVSQQPAAQVALYSKPQKEECDNYPFYSVKNAENKQTDIDYEGFFICKKIKELVGREYIYDSSIKAKRAIEYKDIAILMYKRKGSGIIDQLSQNNIPYSAPGFKAERIYQIDLLADYLRIIDNMQNDIPLSSVMQSPLYNFTSLEMLNIRKEFPKGFFWEAVVNFSGNNIIKQKIMTLQHDLKRYRKMISYCNVYELMLKILGDGFDAYLLSEGEEITSQVNTFINSVKGREYSGNIADFLQFFDKAFDNKLSIPSAADAVKVMTIHNSKGLEFPVVFVAEAHSGYAHIHDNNKDLYLDNELGIAAKYFNEKDKIKKDTLLIKGFKLKSKYREKEQLLRLMYVAFTRAKNHLFIVGEDKKCKHRYNDMQDNFIQWLNLAKLKNPQLEDHFMVIGNETATETESDVKIIKNTSVDLSELDFAYEYSNSVSVPAKYSVSALKDTADTDYEERVSYLTKEERIEKGVNLHKIIELIDFNLKDIDEIRVSVSKMAEKGMLPCKTVEEEDILTITKLLNSEIIELCRKSKYMKEKRFMLYLPLKEVKENCDISDKVLVQGAIDLIILGENNIIVDFKVTQSSVETIKERYKKQLTLYKLAAEKLLKIKVKKMVIYVINRNIMIDL